MQSLILKRFKIENVLFDYIINVGKDHLSIGVILV